MKQRKCKNIILFFMLFVFFGACFVLDAEAGGFGEKEYLGWIGMPSPSFNEEYATVKVEKGEEFYVGDYVGYGKFIGTEDLGMEDIGYGTGTMYVYKNYTATMIKAKYRSSNKKVATVSSKGYMKAKKIGKTIITVSYKGKVTRMQFQVVGKGKLKKSKIIRQHVNKINQSIPQIPDKITTKNGIKLCQEIFKKRQLDYTSWEKTWGSYKEYVNADGFLVSNGQTTNKLVAPKAGRYHVLECMAEQYEMKYNPEDTDSPDVLKIKKLQVDSKADKVIVTLEKPLTKKQYIALLAEDSRYAVLSKEQELSASVCYTIGLYDKDDKDKYFSLDGVAKLGSDKIVMDVSYFVAEENMIVPGDLKSGHKYQLGKKNEWTRGKKARAKDYPDSLYKGLED